MLSTKNISTGGGNSTPKTLSPGNNEIKINSIRLETVPYNRDAYHLVIDAEGPDMGSTFEGFLIDKNDPSQGSYKGQVGRIRMSEYAYADGVTKRGDQIYRDQEIMVAIKKLCQNFSCVEWFDAQDDKHDTIESLVAQFNSDKPFANQWLRVCIAGREYTNKAGYKAYDLFIPKASREGVGMESSTVLAENSRVFTYNPDIHIKKSKTQEVTSFGNAPTENITTTSNVANDFEL
jgi:hypothetical protein